MSASPRRRLPGALFALALAAGAVAESALAAELSVEIAGTRSAAGHLRVAVHGVGSAATFPDAATAVHRLAVTAREEVLRLSLPDLAPGRYAIAAFHDENDNGELDTNLVGMPVEGWGVSNDAAGRFGPPDFQAAAITLGAAPVTARITLDY